MWRRSQATEATPDEAAYLLDLAAFAENRLDDDETARIAALVACDPHAADDVAAARRLATAAMTPADAAIVSRAEALVGEGRPEAVLIAFPIPRSGSRPWHSAATWSSLAAALVLAGWLGFDLGNGISKSPVFGRPADDLSANELLDAAPLVVRDFTESSRI